MTDITTKAVVPVGAWTLNEHSLKFASDQLDMLPMTSFLNDPWPTTPMFDGQYRPEQTKSSLVSFLTSYGPTGPVDLGCIYYYLYSPRGRVNLPLARREYVKGIYSQSSYALASAAMYMRALLNRPSINTKDGIRSAWDPDVEVAPDYPTIDYNMAFDRPSFFVAAMIDFFNLVRANVSPGMSVAACWTTGEASAKVLGFLYSAEYLDKLVAEIVKIFAEDIDFTVLGDPSHPDQTIAKQRFNKMLNNFTISRPGLLREIDDLFGRNMSALATPTLPIYFDVQTFINAFHGVPLPYRTVKNLLPFDIRKL